ncbi:hypothetical protein GG344DRAFT_83991 [Lentinula edodes]|nr:hypothetical protein GG344DRAFT_83991 [Lentinula edodes]
MIQGLLRPLNLFFHPDSFLSLLSSLISCDLGPPEAYLPHQHLYLPPGPAQATPSPHLSQKPSWLLSSLISCDVELPKAYLLHQYQYLPPGVLQPLIQPDLL